MPDAGERKGQATKNTAGQKPGGHKQDTKISTLNRKQYELFYLYHDK